MKICFKCGETKPLDDFYKHPQMGDGHLNKCKECTKRDSMEHRWNNLESIRQYDRDRSRLPQRKQRNKVSLIAYRHENPDADRAHSKVSHYVRNKKLYKPNKCSICGNEVSLIHGHHEDYSKPLDVIWVCVPCHAQIHAGRIDVYGKAEI